MVGAGRQGAAGETALGLSRVGGCFWVLLLTAAAVAALVPVLAVALAPVGIGHGAVMSGWSGARSRSEHAGVGGPQPLGCPGPCPSRQWCQCFGAKAGACRARPRRRALTAASLLLFQLAPS